jgi:putative modified peptide
MPFKLSEQTVDTLLNKLSSDDDFRELFQKDPREALNAAGHIDTAGNTISDEELAGMQSQTLASKNDITASRNVLRKQLLTEQACLTPVHLNVQKP